MVQAGGDGGLGWLQNELTSADSKCPQQTRLLHSGQGCEETEPQQASKDHASQRLVAGTHLQQLVPILSSSGESQGRSWMEKF